MISGFVYLILSLLTLEQEAIFRTSDPGKPYERLYNYEARCDQIVLNMIYYGFQNRDVADHDSVGVFINGNSISIPANLSSFINSDRSTYRISTVCPHAEPSIQLRLYRASANADDSLTYAQWSLTIHRDGNVVDYGQQVIEADDFWFR